MAEPDMPQGTDHPGNGQPYVTGPTGRPARQATADQGTMACMSPLPFPVRIAAGLVVTAVEQARELPRHAVELPVTAVSQALQVSMRVQQRITELAIKGDRALGTLRPADDVPSWATFDDDRRRRRPLAARPGADRPAAAARRPGRPQRHRVVAAARPHRHPDRPVPVVPAGGGVELPRRARPCRLRCPSTRR